MTSRSPERDGKRSIAFVGFMGAGKSAAARAVAEALGEELIDTDEVIEAEVGKPIADLFAREGEAAFRSIERRVALESLDRGVVVALGGGAVEIEEVREALARHLTVWCRVGEGVAWERARDTGRPLAADREEFRRRFELREPLYREIVAAVLPKGGKGVATASAPWLAALRDRPRLRMAWASSASGEYPAIVGRAAGEVLLAPPGSAVRAAPPVGARLFAVADRVALAACGELMPPVEETIEIDGGERAKTLAEAGRVLERLAAAGVRRDDALLAFGGGVAGDLAGFCAAVYQRGIPIVHVPTTLVGQVDSAYGGKTGVDLPGAKNYVGAYHQPAAVLSDPAALATLPAPELAAGFAEVVKTALIAGGELWERVRGLDAPTPDGLAGVIFDCALTKLEIVAADERDAGRRAVLNLGHTVGHAIEAASGYRARHGDAVALGLLAALRLSGAEELRDEVAALLERAGLPAALDPSIELEQVLVAVGRDKKRTAAGIGFVLLERPGEPRHGQRVEPDRVRAAVEELSGR